MPTEDDVPATRPGISRRKMMAGVGAGAATVWVAPAITRAAVVTAATSVPPGPPNSTTFDLYASVSVAAGANPTAAGFSFLQLAGGAFTSLMATGSLSALPAKPGYQGSDNAFPVVAINTAAAPYTFSTLTMPPFSVLLHPGQNSDAAVGFAIPAGASASFTAIFTDDDPNGGDGALVSVLVHSSISNTLVPFAAPALISGFGGGTPSATFSGSLPAGTDKIYAVVNGAAEYTFDSTRLQLTVTVTGP